MGAAAEQTASKLRLISAGFHSCSHDALREVLSELE